MIRISAKVELPEGELEWKAIRSGGPGGQHVNKVSTSVQLRFDIASSSLPGFYKERLLSMEHHQILNGRICIDVSEHRSQEKNRSEALRKFTQLIRSATIVAKKRKKTRPTRASVARRLEGKRQRSDRKSMRRRPGLD